MTKAQQNIQVLYLNAIRHMITEIIVDSFSADPNFKDNNYVQSYLTFN